MEQQPTMETMVKAELLKKTYQGKKVFHTKGTGWTSGMIKWFFEVDDYYESYFDKEKNLSSP